MASVPSKVSRLNFVVARFLPTRHTVRATNHRKSHFSYLDRLLRPHCPAPTT